MQLTNTTLVDAPLPDTQGPRLNAIRIALILMGALIALPAFVMGAKLNEAMGTRDSMIAAVAIAGLIESSCSRQQH